MSSETNVDRGSGGCDGSADVRVLEDLAKVLYGNDVPSAAVTVKQQIDAITLVAALIRVVKPAMSEIGYSKAAVLCRDLEEACGQAIGTLRNAKELKRCLDSIDPR